MKRICFVILFLWCAKSFSQNTFLESFYTAGIAQNMFGKKTSDSGYLLYGFNYFTGNNLLTKTDSNGIVVFSKYYNLPNNYLVRDAFESPTGYTLLSSGIDSTICTIKTDLNGSFISGKTIYSPLGAIDFYLLGKIGSDVYIYGSMAQNSAIAKLDSSGTVLWVKQYSTSFQSNFNSGVISKNNELFITGSIADPTNLDWYTSILKLDSSGTLIWNKQFRMYNRFHIAATNEAGLIISMYDMAIKFDSVGTIQWCNLYNIGSTYSIFSGGIKSTYDGGYIIGGNLNSTTPNSPLPAFLLHINQLGVADWMKTYGTINHPEIGSIEIASDSSYIVVGTNTGFASTTTENGYMFKTDISGNLGCFDNSISVINSSNTIIEVPFTFSTSNAFLHDTVFLPTPIVTNEPNNFICSSTGISQQEKLQSHLFPNPIHDNATLVVSKNDKYNLVAYDVYGKIIFERKINSLETEIDFSQLPNGIYFYQLSNSENNLTGKFVVAH